MMRKVLISLLVMLLAVGTVYAAPKDDAKNLVEKAVSYYKANGNDKTIAEINNPKGQFIKGDMYVFIWSTNYSVVAHPTNPALIGKDLKGLKDPDGKAFVFEAVELAKAKGSGWMDYKYTNPVSKKIEQKSTFVKKVDTLVFACGIYK